MKADGYANFKPALLYMYDYILKVLASICLHDPSRQSCYTFLKPNVLKFTKYYLITE
jgi:hypothetical protein